MARDVPTLFFIWAPGCPHCSQTKPHVKKFEQKHPEIKVEWLDITETEWPDGVWAPSGTPAFVFTKHGERARSRTGVHTMGDLEKWLGL